MAGAGETVGGTRRTHQEEVLAELASLAVEGDAVEPMLLRVADLARRTLPAVQDASITVIERHRPRTAVFTGDLALDLDEGQYELGFGPCLDAARSGSVLSVEVDDQSSPYRAFAELAARRGVRQVVAVGMPLAHGGVGGLNLYRTVAAPVPDPLLDELKVFVAYASVTLGNITGYARATRESATLRDALDSRAVIEQAKGILIARERCTPDEAFALLSRMSQHEHVKLRDVAARIVAAATA